MQCSQCGFVLGAVAPTAPGPTGAPTWPYPSGMSRTLPTFNRSFGLWFTVFPLLLGIILFPILLGTLREASIGGMFPLLFLILLPVMGRQFLKASKQEQENAKKLWAEGLPCWQVQSATPTGGSRSHGGLRWMHLLLELDAYPAPGTAAAPSGPIRVKCAWYISDMQAAMAQPGGWMALLVDRNDPSIVQLEAVRTPNGGVAPLT